MTDETLRRLELSWHESGSIEDEARVLRARLRAGRIAERGLVIAAGLGHEAAALVAPAIGLGPLELITAAAWPEPLACPRARAAVAMARAHLDAYASQRIGTREEHRARIRIFEESARAAEDWVVCPCLDHAAELARVDDLPVNDCGQWCCTADELADLTGGVLQSVLACAAGERVDPYFVLRLREWSAQDSWSRRVAEAAIRADVIPWALGYGDPLRERIRSGEDDVIRPRGSPKRPA